MAGWWDTGWVRKTAGYVAPGNMKTRGAHALPIVHACTVARDGDARHWQDTVLRTVWVMEVGRWTPKTLVLARHRSDNVGAPQRDAEAGRRREVAGCRKKKEAGEEEGGRGGWPTYWGGNEQWEGDEEGHNRGRRRETKQKRKKTGGVLACHAGDLLGRKRGREWGAEEKEGKDREDGEEEEELGQERKKKGGTLEMEGALKLQKTGGGRC